MWYAFYVKEGQTFKEYKSGQLVSTGTVLPEKLPDEVDVVEVEGEYDTAFIADSDFDPVTKEFVLKDTSPTAKVQTYIDDILSGVTLSKTDKEKIEAKLKDYLVVR